MNIPNIDLRVQHNGLREELNDAIWRVIDNSSFVLGPEVARFEEAFADYIGVKYAIGTGSGTAALQVALMAMGLHRGDEVLVPAMTFYATAEAVVLCGGKPVFVDIDPKTLCMDPNKVEQAMTVRTRGILPVHLHGHPADMDALGAIAQRRDIWIIEDVAHSPGARYKGQRVGSFGSANAFSFYPGKNIGAMGEAGIVTSNDDSIAKRCREFRDHGSPGKFRHYKIGFNGRMDGMQAAILSVKLPHLDDWNESRRRIAKRYTEAFRGSNVYFPFEHNDVEHIYHVYGVKVRWRDRVMKLMQEKGVGVNIHYPVPMHQHPGFDFLDVQEGGFPVAERYARDTLSLPCFPEMTDEQVDYVIQSLLESVDEVAKTAKPYRRK